MTTQSITSITEGQQKQYKRFVEDAAERALEEVGLDKDGLQKLIENGDEFQSDIVASIKRHSVSNQFTNEEVASTYIYPPEYRCRPIEEQIERLAKIFGLDPQNAYTFAKNLPQLPDGAEGWFAIPRQKKIAPTDSEAVELVFAKIAEHRTFHNYRSDQLSPDRFRQNERTVRILAQIAEQQKGDILIISAQFGLCHRGRSVRRAREVFMANEFGLGAFAVGIMLLIHPEREVQWEQLHVDCAGDEFSPDAGGRFGLAPCFFFSDGWVKFGTRWFGSAVVGYGAASAFLPQAS